MPLSYNHLIRPAQASDAAAMGSHLGHWDLPGTSTAIPIEPRIYTHYIRNTIIPLEEQPVTTSQMADRVDYAVTHPVGMVEKALRHLILSGYDR